MTLRTVTATHRGSRTVDGAGVHLVRVLSAGEARAYDPFLMLDSFDSTNPDDYLAGFPMHPHRGIETITYLISGCIAHEDSLGNRGEIRPGESQWMCAGNGILHQEMPQASDRMLGFQLWLNLPAAEKMCDPTYRSLGQAQIPVVQEEGASVHVIGGRYGGASGARPGHVQATLLDVELDPGATLTLPVAPEDTAFAFTLLGAAQVGGTAVSEKTAALLGPGDAVTLAAPPDAPARVIFYAGKPLDEPIAWGGPIVMNTQAELRQAFDELRAGTFIRHNAGRP